MSEEMRTYLVGRRNSTVACDIAVPEHEKSVSRKHLELTVTASGRCYIVHVHPQNTTKVRAGDGNWVTISQDYVELDTPLLLGGYQTTARALLSLLPRAGAPVPPAGPPPQGRVEWDADRGSFIHR